jgi:CRP-like cAMP-binding protein
MPSTITSAQVQNKLLTALPEDQLERFLPYLKPIHLEKSVILNVAGEAVEYAYFPNSGMISLLSTTESGSTIEVAMVGQEGMVGIPLVLLMNTSPYESVIQITSEALQISSALLIQEFKRGDSLQKIVLRYTHVLLTQIAQSAVCNRFHTIEKRLCRWLLIARDRVDSDYLDLTQEIIAHMLGTPRTGITMAARVLQEQGLIRYARGKITILNRPGLEAGSCECYTILKSEFDRFYAGL